MPPLAHPSPRESRVRAQALRMRAAAAINRACGLVAWAAVARAQSHESWARYAAHGLALLRPSSAPWAPSPAPRSSPPASVVRRRSAHREAAAHERPLGEATASWAHAPVLRERAVRDAAGDRWTVRELDAARLPGSRGWRCLVFENSSIVRRVWHFPEAWHELEPDALLRLATEHT
jgi:hypothetical protein